MIDRDVLSTLRVYLEGSQTPLTQALIRLDLIKIDPKEVIEELGIKPCRRCSRWTDEAIMDNRMCPRCDDASQPKERSTE